MKTKVTFTKTVEVVVDTLDDMRALKHALNTPGLLEAFNEAQTIFTMSQVLSTVPDGIFEAMKVPEILT